MVRDGIIVHQFPVEKTLSEFGYPKVNVCIYCGKMPSHLTKEHIIGKAIGGTITLAKSSCVPCREITRELERSCFRDMMRYFRLKSGFRSSHPKKGKVKIPARIGEDPPVILELARHELPGVACLFKTPPPTMFFGDWPRPESVTLWQFVSDMKWPTNTVFSSGRLHCKTYYRMLAKVAHSYAVAELGLGNFNPFLQSTIRYHEPDPFRYIGCIGQTGKRNYPKEKCLHRLNFECWETKDGLFMVLRMRLLAYIGAPEYHAVVGSVSEIPKAAMTRAFSSKMLSTQTRK
jgi:hypothetical protein